MKKFLFLLFFLLSVPAFADEVILNYDADINVQTDASVVVRERITVNREGHKIRRGIYRDLPRIRGVEYTVLSVRRDNKPEPHFTENVGGNFRINTGTDAFLPYNGVYTFEITYRATNVIQGFKDYDELYWNVVGDQWAFPIRSVSARVTLPEGASATKRASYVGTHGSTENGAFSNGVFSAGRALRPGEFLTIAVGFDKGFVTLPDLPFYYRLPARDAFRYSLMIFAAYLLISWYLVGRDPEKETVMPRFDGPADLTPAQAGFIYAYGQNAKECLAAALIQGGITGFFKIKETSYFSINTRRPAANSEEKLFEKKMKFPLTLYSKHSSKMEVFSEEFQAFLKKVAAEKYFTSNKPFTVVAFILLMALILFQCFLLDVLPFAGIMAFYLFFFIPMGREFSKILATGVFRFTPLVTLLFILLHFSIFSLQVVYANPEVSRTFLFYVIGCLVIPFYSHLIIRPTRKGMHVIVHLDGIKMFLKAVHTGIPAPVDFNKMEKLLPYAVLFGLEKEWGEKMDQITEKMKYQPQWYSGRVFSSSRLTGFCATVSTTCTRPSSSGSGGGGHAGGGFGGGGGGGR